MPEPVSVCTFDAVIFDLAGVLLDSEPIYLAATNSVLAAEGKYISPEQNARYIGVRVRDMRADMSPGLRLSHDADYYIEAARAAVLEGFGKRLRPLPGARELIER